MALGFVKHLASSAFHGVTHLGSDIVHGAKTAVVDIGKAENTVGKDIQKVASGAQRLVGEGATALNHVTDSAVNAFEHSPFGDNFIGRALGSAVKDTVHFDTGVVEGASSLVTGVVGLAGTAARVQGALTRGTVDSKYRAQVTQGVEKTVSNIVDHPGAIVSNLARSIRTSWHKDGAANFLGQAAGVVGGTVLTAGAGEAGAVGDVAEASTALADSADAARTVSGVSDAARTADGASAATLSPRGQLQALKDAGNQDYAARQSLVADNRTLNTAEAYTRDPLPTGRAARHDYLANPENFLPERQALHNDILDQQLESARRLSDDLTGPNGEKNLILLRGNSGAGKSYGIQNLSGFDISNPDGIINPDAIKSQLISADGGAASFNQTAGEGAAVTSRAIDQLFDHQLSGVIDKRFGTPGEIAPILERARAAGYNTTVLDFDTGLATSAERVLAREVGGDSPNVPFDAIAEGYQQARGERAAVAALENIDHYSLFQDGNLIAQRVGGGPLEQLDPAAYQVATSYGPDEIAAAREQYGAGLDARSNQAAADPLGMETRDLQMQAAVSQFLQSLGPV